MADLTFHYFSCSLLILSTNSSGVSIFYNFIVYLFFCVIFRNRCFGNGGFECKDNKKCLNISLFVR